MATKDEFQFVFGTAEGKRVLSHICREAGVLQPTNPTMSPTEISFYAGQRNVALMILTALDEEADNFPQLTKEIQDNGS